MSVLPSVEDNRSASYVNSAFDDSERGKMSPPPSYADVVDCARPAVYVIPQDPSSASASAPPAPRPETAPPQRRVRVEPPVETPPPRRQRPPRPPASDSLCGQIKIEQWESTSCIDFFKRVVMLFMKRYGFIILLVFMAGPTLSMLVVGGAYSSDENCPVSTFLYVYLIVWGIFGTLRGVVGAFAVMARMNGTVQQKSEEEKNKENCWMAIWHIFLLGWLIAGCVLVFQHYSTWSPVKFVPDTTATTTQFVNASELFNVSTTTTTTSRPRSTKIPPGMKVNPYYCHPTLYSYAVVVTVTICVLVLLIIIIFICWLVKLGMTRK